MRDSCSHVVFTFQCCYIIITSLFNMAVHVGSTHSLCVSGLEGFGVCMFACLLAGMSVLSVGKGTFRLQEPWNVHL